MPRFITSEAVSSGHPDKIADQISDAIVDAFLTVDPKARVAVETLVTTGLVVLAGEVSKTDETLPVLGQVQDIARQTIADIGYTDPALKFDAEGCAVMSTIHGQSPDISQGVDTGGAGDQGMMYGYACNETKDFMPLSLSISQSMMNKHRELRDQNWLRPDGKCQVTICYDDQGRPEGISNIVFSTQHPPVYNHTQEILTEMVMEEIIGPVQDEYKIDMVPPGKILINPTGRFEIGGPHGDTGLTGRKIIADTYGGIGRHGGGAFSGKDPSKVDRSAAYMARFIAKNIVAATGCRAVEVQLAYAIGVVEPVSVLVDVVGSTALREMDWDKIVRKCFPLTPAGIIDHLDLRRPMYKDVAAGCHFGGDRWPWEQLTAVPLLQKLV